MDVNAIVAQAHTGGAPPERPAAPAAPPPPPTPPLQAPLPQKGPAVVKPNADRSGTSLKLAILAVVLVVVAAAVLFLLPLVARERAIATAREAGFEITVGGAGIDTSGITLHDVVAKVTHTPGVTATMKEIHVGGFGAKKDLRIFGLDAKLDGERADLEVGLGLVFASDRTRLAGTTAAPHHLSIVGGRLTWTSPSGDHLAASDIGIDLDSFGAGNEEIHGAVGRFELTTKGTTFGPWSSSFESSAGTSRVRLMFDPPIPEGPSALAVWHKEGATELTVKVPRSSMKNLGVRPADLGIPADDGTDVQISVTGMLSDVTNSELTFDASIWGLRPQGAGGAIDVHTDGTAKGTPGKPLDLEKTTATAGPFAAGVTGTITPHGRGVRLDALFKVLPIACERLARAQAKNMGTLAATLQDLGQSTGVLKVTGTVNASGILKFDTAEPETASLTWLAKETCGVSIFGM